MTYVAPLDSPRLRHAYERPALCALEAAAIAAQQALRHRFPITLGRTDTPSPTHCRILALILLDRLDELLGTIDMYELEVAREASHSGRGSR